MSYPSGLQIGPCIVAACDFDGGSFDSTHGEEWCSFHHALRHEHSVQPRRIDAVRATYWRCVRHFLTRAAIAAVVSVFAGRGLWVLVAR